MADCGFSSSWCFDVDRCVALQQVLAGQSWGQSLSFSIARDRGQELPPVNYTQKLCPPALFPSVCVSLLLLSLPISYPAARGLLSLF